MTHNAAPMPRQAQASAGEGEGKGKAARAVHRGVSQNLVTTNPVTRQFPQTKPFLPSHTLFLSALTTSCYSPCALSVYTV